MCGALSVTLCLPYNEPHKVFLIYSHLTDEETGGQRGQASCPRPLLLLSHEALLHLGGAVQARGMQ